LIVDSVLILRLYAVYHPRTTRALTVVSVFTFPALVKIARIVVIGIFLRRLINFGRTNDNMCLAMAVFFPRDRFIVSEWILQAVDNLYTSTLFIYRLRGQTLLFSGTSYRTKRIMARLFFIAVGNFVFPVILNLTQIIYLFFNDTYVHGSVILLINVYVSIIGVVFATVWVSGDAYMASNHASTGTGSGVSKYTNGITAAPRDATDTFGSGNARSSRRDSYGYGYGDNSRVVQIYVEKTHYASSTDPSLDEKDEPPTPLPTRASLPPQPPRMPVYTRAGSVPSMI